MSTLLSTKRKLARCMSAHPGATARVGRRAITDFRRQACARIRPRSRARRAWTATRCACTKRPSIGRRRTARTEQSRRDELAGGFYLARGSMTRAPPIWQRHEVALHAGSPTARSGSWTSAWRTARRAGVTVRIAPNQRAQLDLLSVDKASGHLRPNRCSRTGRHALRT